jgi:hypothetical protein
MIGGQMCVKQTNIFFQLVERKGMKLTFSNRNPFAVVFTIINPMLCLLITMGSTTTELQATSMARWKGVEDVPSSILDMNPVAGCIMDPYPVVLKQAMEDILFLD